jgi:RNA polymerase sigma factor (sigma-70 family)
MGGSPKDPLVEAEDRDSFAEPRCRLQAKESREVMSLAIRQLPSRQREAATLFGMQGMTYGEAAGSLGTSIIAFKSLVYRARANLRRMLAEYDDAGQLSPPLRDAIAADSPQLAPMH